MSKGTVRFPESAIADGRVGTARIREQIAKSAAHCAADGDVGLDAALQRLVGSTGNTPRGRRGPVSQSNSSLEHGNADKPEPGKLKAALAGHAPSPVERMQELGRLGTGVMNKTEAAYEQVLAARRHTGEILWYRFEGHKLRLADNTFYTPDFAVIVASGALEFHEVKGHWTDKARAKTKVAAAQYPHRFIAVKRAGRHGWQFEDMTGKSW